MASAFDALMERARRMEDLKQALFLLEWDQHTYMPPGGVEARSRTVTTLSSLRHEALTAPETGRLLAAAEREAATEDEKANLRELRWEYDRATLVPASLVEALAKETSEAFPRWVAARRASAFSKFAGSLERLVALRRKYAEHVDASAPAYEVLFNDYEPWLPLPDARRNLARLRDGLRTLLARAPAAPRDGDLFAGREWPAERQMALAKRVCSALGYDFEHGRIDLSPHPFSTGNPYDARITTRFEPGTPVQGLLAAIHEVGHALYMLGLPKDAYGMPIGDARDLVVHESQSRLWENHVGRSLAFWEQALPMLRDEFPGALADANAEDVWRSVNRVAPSHIRVYADELTYHMHIALRFEIEEAMISGNVRVAEVPTVWNDLAEKYLGVRPPDDASGCLQDMHWSGGSFGYFPTYSLGSMLAAQIHAAYQRATPAAPTDHARLKAWLVENVHRHGRRYKTTDLITRATGGPLAPDAFLAYASDKYARVWS